MSIPYTFDPNLDLKLERFIDVPVELVWKVWTEPEHVKVWFCPKPWGVSDCEIDLRPGGMFRTTMLSPEGQEFPNMGCYLDIVPMERLVFTDALLPGYRPAEKSFMTGVVTMKPEGTGTRYIAMAIHNNLEAKKQHEEMGFHDGWATALDQLVEYAKTLG